MDPTSSLQDWCKLFVGGHWTPAVSSCLRKVLVLVCITVFMSLSLWLAILGKLLTNSNGILCKITFYWFTLSKFRHFCSTFLGPIGLDYILYFTFFSFLGMQPHTSSHYHKEFLWSQPPTITTDHLFYRFWYHIFDTIFDKVKFLDDLF